MPNFFLATPPLKTAPQKRQDVRTSRSGLSFMRAFTSVVGASTFGFPGPAYRILKSKTTR